MPAKPKKTAKVGRGSSNSPLKKVSPAEAKPSAKPRKKSRSREGSKAEAVLELLRRKDGATTAEIAKATGWQNHTIRAFVSAHVAKKMGLGVESAKNEAGERFYRITA